MATTEAPRLPTEAEYDAAGKAMQKAFDEVEHIVWMMRGSLQRKDEKGVQLTEEPDAIDTIVVPTLSDVGRAYSFVSDLTSEVEQFERERGRASEYLDLLDEARLNGAIRAKA